MDEETKKFLVENYTLNKENNEMLKKLVLFQKWNQIYKIIYWSILILSAIGAFYFLKQYLVNLVSLYTGGIDTTNVSGMLNNGDKVNDFVKSLNSN